MTHTKPGKEAATKSAPPSVYQSGFCSLGSHENTKPVSPSGKPLRTCPVGGKFAYPWKEGGDVACTCDCHAMTRQLEELTGVQFPAFDSRKTSSPLSGLALLDGALDGTDRLQQRLSPRADRPSVTTTSGVRFAATPTGRAARGQLEEEVRTVICAQVKAAGEDMIAMLGLTPDTISQAISRDDPPSTGAVYAILKRWDGRVQVELAERPFRFIKFTDKGKRDLFR